MFSTTTVMWVIGLWIAKARPCARGRKRLSVGPFVGRRLDDEQVVAVEVVVVLGVGGGAVEHLGHVTRRVLRHVLEDRRGLVDGQPDDRAG